MPVGPSVSTFRQAGKNHQRGLESAKRVYTATTRKSVTCQKLSIRDFWLTANSVLSKVKFTILLLCSVVLKCCFKHMTM